MAETIAVAPPAIRSYFCSPLLLLVRVHIPSSTPAARTLARCSVRQMLLLMTVADLNHCPNCPTITCRCFPTTLCYASATRHGDTDLPAVAPRTLQPRPKRGLVRGQQHMLREGVPQPRGVAAVAAEG